MVGKDQPPDLAAFVPSGSTVLPDTPEKVASSQVSTGNHVILDSKSVAGNSISKKFQFTVWFPTCRDSIFP